ncbi:receptor-like protein 15 [Vitis riparia]|uniref:receptor-like protein 15 n=1 Tax=Vitis riparia TaxID=96939 RepID=UPI00155A85B2|nr:receptor-like protein 15 [Vitis riparia]
MPSNISVSLPNLMFLNVSRNSFEGSIPSFGGMRKLLFLDLSNNSFTGGIPEDLAMGCPSLEYLILSKNDLHGQMFPRVSNLPRLRHLHLDGNHFSGKIPDLSNSSGLERLDVSHNSISGKLPGWIGNMSNLAALVMPNNSLEGPIPVEFCSLDALQLLDLSNNNLSGSLPSCFSPYSLIHVHLQENHLTGPLTKAFTRSMDLATLDIRNNNLSGGIPDWISMFSGLSILLLKGNHFQGKIPYQLCQLSKITILDLSYNSLSGHIPSCLNKIQFRTGFRSGKFSIISYFPSPGFSSYLYHSQHIELSQVNVNSYPIAYDKAMAEFTTKNRTDFYKGNFLYSMTGIDLSSNKLTGAIPPEIGNLSQVHALNLSHNILTGPIPAAFSGLRSIESLDLSYNNLTGTIPGELTELTNLAVFSVAYNNLSGKIPEMTAQFGTFLENSYVGNPYLCGSRLRKNCSRAEEEAEIDEGEKGLTDRDIFYVSFGASYVVVLLGVAAVLYINGGWRKKWFHVIDVLITCCCNFVMHLVGKFSS